MIVMNNKAPLKIGYLVIVLSLILNHFVILIKWNFEIGLHLYDIIPQVCGTWLLRQNVTTTWVRRSLVSAWLCWGLRRQSGHVWMENAVETENAKSTSLVFIISLPVIAPQVRFSFFLIQNLLTKYLLRWIYDDFCDCQFIFVLWFD